MNGLVVVVVVVVVNDVKPDIGPVMFLAAR